MGRIGVIADENGDFTQKIRCGLAKYGEKNTDITTLDVAGGYIDMLVAAPDDAPPNAGVHINCRIAVIPGWRAAEFIPYISAQSVVTYGTGMQDTLSVSSVEG